MRLLIYRLIIPLGKVDYKRLSSVGQGSNIATKTQTITMNKRSSINPSYVSNTDVWLCSSAACTIY
jgi:hypothetical protein